jgi:hypothetical protein
MDLLLTIKRFPLFIKQWKNDHLMPESTLSNDSIAV